MKKISRWFKSIFTPKDLQAIDIQEILAAMNEEPVRKLWLYDTLQELKRMNLEIDKRLLNGVTYDLTDLAARRKAFQDFFEGILSAKRQVHSNNPKSEGKFDLDSVTEGSAYL